MLTIDDHQLSTIAVSRITRLVAEQLQKHCAGLLGADPQELLFAELQAYVEEVRLRLVPWQLDGERLVVKYCVGSLMLGQHPDEIDPRMKETLVRRDWTALRKESFLDESITALLEHPQVRGGAAR